MVTNTAQTKQTSTNITKQTTATPTVKTTATSTVVADANSTIFKIQVSAGSADLKETDKQFKGYKIEKYKDGNKFKYFTGASTDYEQVRKTKNDIKGDFPNCFIVAFKNGQQVDVIKAIEEWKKSK